VRRPNPAQWLWYAWGGKLPQRYREWVLHDVTTRTWLLRHMIRAIVLTLTVVAVVFVPLLLVVHVVFWLAIAAVVLGVLVSVYYSMSYAWESGDVRLTKYGYPTGYGSGVRQRIAEERDRETQEKYNAVWRQ
jgi:uncharacterized protein DUF5313